MDGQSIIAGYSYLNIYGIDPAYWGMFDIFILNESNGNIVEQTSVCHQEYVGAENIPMPRPYPQHYAILSNPLGEDAELPIENTDEFIVLTTYDEDLDFVDSVHVGPPGSYVGIRAYEFTRCSGGYMVTGVVKDSSSDWHMWIGLVDTDFDLQTSYYGSSDTGCFGEVYSALNQMGGCVTESGNFMAAGAEYLSTGHTDCNVMFQPDDNDTGYGTPLEPGAPAGSRSADGLSVYSNSELNHFNIQYHGEISGEPVANVYSICGRNVATLHGTRDAEGSVSFTFDANSSEGCLLPSGVYVVTVNTGNSIEAATFTLLQ